VPCFRVDRDIDVHLFEAATVFDSEKARHTETNKETQNAVAVTGMELLEGRLPGFIVFFIFAFCFKLIRSYTFV
jgi:hypothetical protein